MIDFIIINLIGFGERDQLILMEAIEKSESISLFRAVFTVRHQLAQLLPHVLAVRIAFNRISFLLNLLLDYLIDCQLEGII
jgi:hypothetical protein